MCIIHLCNYSVTKKKMSSAVLYRTDLLNHIATCLEIPIEKSTSEQLFQGILKSFTKLQDENLIAFAILLSENTKQLDNFIKEIVNNETSKCIEILFVLVKILKHKPQEKQVFEGLLSRLSADEMHKFLNESSDLVNRLGDSQAFLTISNTIASVRYTCTA